MMPCHACCHAMHAMDATHACYHACHVCACNDAVYMYCARARVQTPTTHYRRTTESTDARVAGRIYDVIRRTTPHRGTARLRPAACPLPATCGLRQLPTTRQLPIPRPRLQGCPHGPTDSHRLAALARRPIWPCAAAPLPPTVRLPTANCPPPRHRPPAVRDAPLLSRGPLICGLEDLESRCPQTLFAGNSKRRGPLNDLGVLGLDVHALALHVHQALALALAQQQEQEGLGNGAPFDV